MIFSLYPLGKIPEPRSPCHSPTISTPSTIGLSSNFKINFSYIFIITGNKSYNKRWTATFLALPQQFTFSLQQKPTQNPLAWENSLIMDTMNFFLFNKTNSSCSSEASLEFLTWEKIYLKKKLWKKFLQNYSYFSNIFRVNSSIPYTWLQVSLKIF